MITILVLDNISKSYGKKKVVENISFGLRNGVTALLAPNGYGKTTILKMLSTIEEPTSGEILYQGQNIGKLRSRYRDVIGYLPQRVGFYKDWTGQENLEYLSVLKGVDKDIARERIDYWLDVFNLTDARDNKAKTYSGGMIQRIGIIGALLNDPEILLLDEPSAGLDPTERKNLKSVLAHLGQSKSVLISTHITGDVEFLANNILMLDKGNIIYDDDVENIPSVVVGDVYEVDIVQSEYANFITKYQVLEERHLGDMIRIKFYSRDIPAISAQKAVMNLNDMFLILYGRKSVIHE